MYNNNNRNNNSAQANSHLMQMHRMVARGGTQSNEVIC